MWSVVKTKTTMPWQTRICRRVLTWLKTTVRSFFLKMSWVKPSKNWNSIWHQLSCRKDQCIRSDRYSYPFHHGYERRSKRSGPHCQWPSGNGAQLQRSSQAPRCQMLRPLMKQKVPQSPSSPNIRRNVLLGFIAGAGSDGGSHGRSRSLGRSCQETRGYLEELMGFTLLGILCQILRNCRWETHEYIRISKNKLQEIHKAEEYFNAFYDEYPIEWVWIWKSSLSHLVPKEKRRKIKSTSNQLTVAFCACVGYKTL